MGSQSMRYCTVPVEHAYEGRHLMRCRKGDVFIARALSPAMAEYWATVVGPFETVNPCCRGRASTPLSRLLVDDERTMAHVRGLFRAGEKQLLDVFALTSTERAVADTLGIPVWGNHDRFPQIGSKSGGRALAEFAGIPVAPGYVCVSPGDIDVARRRLAARGYKWTVLKTDQSMGGKGILLLDSPEKPLDATPAPRQAPLPPQHGCPAERCIVEAWLPAQMSIGVHLEVPPPPEPPFVVALWEQLIAQDTTYVGARSLILPESSRALLSQHLSRLAHGLQICGAWGSFGPDLLWLGGEEFALIEINNRLPATTFPLEGLAAFCPEEWRGFFVCKTIALKRATSTDWLLDRLAGAGFLPNSSGYGVLPFNDALLPFGRVSLVAGGRSASAAEELFTAAVELMRSHGRVDGSSS